MHIPDHGELVPTYRCTKARVEKDLVATLIKYHMTKGRSRSGDALNPTSFMILCPTGNIAEEFATSLTKQHSIPARVIRAKVMPDEVWHLVLVLRMIRSNDNLALRQWLEVLGMQPAAIGNLRAKAEQEGLSLFQVCGRAANGPIEVFLRALDHLRAHRNNLEPAFESLRRFPSLNISDEVLSQVGLAEEPEPDSRLSANECIQQVYEDYGVFDVEDNEPPKDAVAVATLHSAKGLEAEIVFLASLEDIFLPMQGRDEEEQRRLLYVGMTRAKSKLILTFWERFNTSTQTLLGNQAMSPFLHEIREYLNIQRIKRQDISAFSAASDVAL